MTKDPNEFDLNRIIRQTPSLGVENLISTSKMNFNIPDSVKNPAKWAHERLINMVTNFQNDLDEEHEVAGYIANYPGGAIHFTDIGYWGPDIIIFEGITEGGTVKLIQNISQINVILISEKKIGEEAIWIGFHSPSVSEDK